ARRDIVSTAVRWPLMAGLPFGCEFDPRDRKVYASYINLGIVVKFDYDSGQVERIFPLGVGVRVLTYDASRKWPYVTNAPTREVTALNVASGTVEGRWFAGRFARHLRLTRDNRGLLVTSNLGLVRIALDHP